MYQPVYLAQVAFYSLVGFGAQWLSIRDVVPQLPANIVSFAAAGVCLLMAHGSLRDGGAL